MRRIIEKGEGPNIHYRDFHLGIDTDNLTYWEKVDLALHLLLGGKVSFSVCGWLKLVWTQNQGGPDVKFGPIEPRLGAALPWEKLPRVAPALKEVQNIDNQSTHKHT